MVFPDIEACGPEINRVLSRLCNLGYGRRDTVRVRHMSSVRLLTGLILLLIFAAYALLLLAGVVTLALIYGVSRSKAPQRAARALRHLRAAAVALGVTILAGVGLNYLMDYLRGWDSFMLIVELERPRLVFEGDAVAFAWAVVVAAVWWLVARAGRNGPGAKAPLADSVP